MNMLTEKANKEILSPTARWAELLIVAALLLLFVFFAYHQFTNTGFFTSKFGVFEMVCLYGPILVSCSAPLVRALTRQRNIARPFEAAGDLCLACGSLWLLMIFPFQYAHFADVLPSALRFILAWVTDDVAKIVLALQVIVGIGSAFALTWQYLTRRGWVAYAAGR